MLCPNFVTPCQVSLYFTVSWSLLKLVHWVRDTIQPYHLLSPSSALALNLFPTSVSFPTSQLFTSGSQSIGVSVLASVLSMNIQGWFPLGLTGLNLLQSKELSRVFSSTTIQKHQFFGAQPSLWSNFHICTWLLEKPQLWLYGPLLAKWCLCFLIHCLGLSQLFFQGAFQVSFNFMAAVTVCSDFGVPKYKICHCFHFSPIYLPWRDGTRCQDLSFSNVEFFIFLNAF